GTYMPNLLITGANRGIGLEFAKQYVEAGWRVFACCRDLDKADALKQLAVQHTGLLSIRALDVANFDQIERLAIEMADQEIDLLLNNAGIYSDTPQGSLGAIDYEAWIHA